MRFKGSSCLETLELRVNNGPSSSSSSGQGQGGSGKRSRNPHPPLRRGIGGGCGVGDDLGKFQITQSHLILIQSNVLIIKRLKRNSSSSLTSGGDELIDLFSETIPEPVLHLKKHSSPINCLGVSNEGWLISTCSDAECILWKWDSMLGNWDPVTLSEGLGLMISTGICWRDQVIYVTLTRRNEIIVIKCSGPSKLEEQGILNLSEIRTLASWTKSDEPFPWIRNILFEGQPQDVVHIVGISYGNGLILKLWEASSSGIKLKDRRTGVNSKYFADGDLMMTGADDNEKYLTFVSPEGHCEVLSVTSSGFTLISRIRLEEYPLESPAALANNDVQIEYNVLAIRFLRLEEEGSRSRSRRRGSSTYTCTTPKSLPLSSPQSGSQLGVDPRPDPDHDPIQEDSDLDNSILNALMTAKSPGFCPKLFIVVATTKGIAIFNVRSGEPDLTLNYEGLLLNDKRVVSNVKIALGGPQNSDLVIGIQPLLDPLVLLSFRVTLEDGEVNINSDDLGGVPGSMSLVATDPLLPKSVLRKKLKSPPKVKEVPKAIPKFRLNALKTRRPKWSGSGSGGGLSTSRSTSAPPPAPGPSSSTSSSTTTNRDRERDLNTWIDGPPPSSSRGIHLTPSGTYSKDNLNFDKISSQSLVTGLPDHLSSLQMSFTPDGKVMALSGNFSPLGIFRTSPTFESISCHMDVGRVTSSDFSFGSKHLVFSHSNGVTTVINWRSGRTLLNFDFSSKFKEHIQTQFFYLDKFILQPEENRVVLYSYKVPEPHGDGIAVRAGSFPLEGQKITALAAANQFYSSTIITALSNKSLQLFDVNAEKVVLHLPNSHSKSISCIRVNEAPKGSLNGLTDLILTSTSAVTDPIKLWDLRSGSCVTRIADLNPSIFFPASRPSLSPCGRYIACGFEENRLILYDIRRVNSRVTTLKDISTSILDTAFDRNYSMIWCGTRNGKLWNFNVSTVSTTPKSI